MCNAEEPPRALSGRGMLPLAPCAHLSPIIGLATYDIFCLTQTLSMTKSISCEMISNNHQQNTVVPMWLAGKIDDIPVEIFAMQQVRSHTTHALTNHKQLRAKMERTERSISTNVQKGQEHVKRRDDMRTGFLYSIASHLCGKASYLQPSTFSLRAGQFSIPNISRETVGLRKSYSREVRKRLRVRTTLRQLTTAVCLRHDPWPQRRPK